MQLLVCFHQVAVTKKEKMVEGEIVLLKRQHWFSPSTAFPSQLALLTPMLRGGDDHLQVVRRHTSYEYNERQFILQCFNLCMTLDS